MYNQDIQVLPPKVLPTIVQGGTNRVQETQVFTETVPVTQSIQQVQVVPVQPVQTQMALAPQVVYVPMQIQVPKPLQPSPPYTSYIPPVPKQPPKPVYQYYKLVPLTTSLAAVPVNQTTVTPNYSTLSTSVVV